MTGIVESSYDRYRFWDALGSPGQAEGTDFFSMDFLKFRQCLVKDTSSSSVLGFRQAWSTTRFLSALLHGGTITAILTFYKRRDDIF